MLSGCLPDLSAWQVVASEPGPGDGGSAQPNPLELGPPCPSPHLVIGLLASSSGLGRVMRFDPSSNALCRTSAVVEVQPSFGGGVTDVDWHPATGAILGLTDAVLGLDGEGFPRWRYEPFDDPYFTGEWVSAFGTGASARVAIAWSERSSSLDYVQLLDVEGHPRGEPIDAPFSSSILAAHPDGGAHVILAARGGDIDVYELNETTTMLHDSTATPLWTGGEDLTSAYGPRNHIATDTPNRRIVITHERGIAFWTYGTTPPSTAIACPSLCASFHAAAPDLADGAYAICAGASGSTRHLVHVSPSACTMVLDGTSLGTRTLQDVALVRAAF